MKKFLAFVLLCFVLFGATAQTPTYWLLDKERSWQKNGGLMIQAHGNGNWGSNALDNQWFYDMTIGGHIGPTQEETLFNSMEDFNRAGGNVSGGLHFYNFSDSLFGGDWGLQVGASTNYFASTGFSRDLFELTYIGNYRHLGDTMNLGPLYAEFQAFQKFGFGFFNKNTFTNAMVSVVMGQDMQKLDVRKADLFTSASVDQMNMIYQGEFLQADTSKSGFGQAKGLGIALDGDINIPMKDDKGFISISARNIGWVNWSENTSVQEFDTTFQWTGVELQGIDSWENNVGVPSWQDTLGISSRFESRWVPLPGWVNLRLLRKLSSKISYEANLNVQPTSNAIPQLSFGFNHFVAKGLMLRERVSYGGFARVTIGLEAQWKLSDRWFITAGTSHAAGWINSNARGLSAYGSAAFVIPSHSISE